MYLFMTSRILYIMSNEETSKAIFTYEKTIGKRFLIPFDFDISSILYAL